MIETREFDWRGTARNRLIDDETYHQRSNVESTFFALRQRWIAPQGENLVRPVKRTGVAVCGQNRGTGGQSGRTGDFELLNIAQLS